MRPILLTIAVLFLACGVLSGGEKEIADHLQAISVTVRAEPSGQGTSQGSGMMICRDIEGDDKTAVSTTFVLTAAHVVEDLRSVKEVIDPKSGTKRSLVKFKDAAIVQELREGGIRVGETRMTAVVFRYSAEHDLAILRVRKTGFAQGSTSFYLGATIPRIGTHVYHVGSPGGAEIGAHSMTQGIIAQIGRDFGGKAFDQTTAAHLPGSSGGGVFRQSDGECIGILTLGIRGADSFNYMVPIRRVMLWAKRARVAWLFNPKEAVPSQAELEQLPIDDSGVTFDDAKGAPQGMYRPLYKESKP